MVILNKVYKTKWHGLSSVEAFALSRKLEDDLRDFLVKNCGFLDVIMTRDSIYSSSGVVLPDLLGIHKSGVHYFIELKNKNRRLILNDNGFDVDKIDAYLLAQERFKIIVLVVFLDDEAEWLSTYPNVKSWFKDEGGVCTYYGNFLSALHLETPNNPITVTSSRGRAVKCFPLANMKYLTDIFKERQTVLDFGVLR